MKSSDVPPVVGRRDLLSVAGVASIASVLGAAAGAMPTAQAQMAPAAGRVQLERLAGGILSIGIDRPGTGNLIDPPILTELGRAYHELDSDDSLQRIVP